MWFEYCRYAKKNKAILRKLLCPWPAYGFCYDAVTYLMVYAFTFILRHGHSPPSAYVHVQPIAASRVMRQTDRQIDTGPHFIMPLPMEVGGITTLLYLHQNADNPEIYELVSWKSTDDFARILLRNYNTLTELIRYFVLQMCSEYLLVWRWTLWWYLLGFFVFISVKLKKTEIVEYV